MNYIGIKGHRGAGKSSIAWLLANTIEFIKNGHGGLINGEIFNNFYQMWCDKIMKDENIILDTEFKYIYIDSFSDSIKVFIQLLLGCPSEYLYNDLYKDSIIINLKDFSYTDISELPNVNLVTSEELYKTIDKNSDPQPIMKNIYINLREFILYFGLEVMQRYFGKNVWVKSLQANTKIIDDFYDNGDSYKIFIDLKTPAEASYIKQQKGVILNIVRPGHKKRESRLEQLNNDNRMDYEIEVNGNLYSTIDQIKNIAIDIINHDKTINRDSKEISN